MIIIVLCFERKYILNNDLFVVVKSQVIHDMIIVLIPFILYLLSIEFKIRYNDL